MKMTRKQMVSALLAALLCLGLAACGEKTEVSPFEADKTPRALMDAGAFSDELEELEETVLLQLYELDESKVTKAVGFASTGLTAEEVAVFEMADEQAAQDAEELLQARLEYQIEANEDYRPNEMPKLDKAVIRRRGSTLLFLVANDYAAAEKALG